MENIEGPSEFQGVLCKFDIFVSIFGYSLFVNFIIKRGLRGREVGYVGRGLGEEKRVHNACE